MSERLLVKNSLLISRITASKAGIQEVDVAVAIAEYLAEKDGEEMVSFS
jgi:hypothetical protein